MPELLNTLIDDIDPPGSMPGAAEGTAWAANPDPLNTDAGMQALDWIMVHPLTDASRGTTALFNYFDRVISTLAEMTALAGRGHLTRHARTL
jgi:hypothetical protein